DQFPSPYERKAIRLQPARVSRMVGQSVSVQRIESILRRLEFDVQREGGDALVVTPPTFRATKDVAIESDLVEEVARSVGYGNIEPVLPRVLARPHETSAIHVLERRSVEALCVGGAFTEVHGYIWYDDTWLARLGAEAGECVRLRNPVAADSARLRRSLIPGLYAASELNRRRMDSFDLLEVGTVFEPGDGEPTARQRRRMGLAAGRQGRDASTAAFDRIK